ncbi:hypothetical protein EVB68_034 [Rhizobium phage RHph_Y2_6]|uniref:Uncharacterized protein n=1 Tax=Rhizobium phage RHph_Y2_6 TaxID=2509576 RepID=A0A7S5QZ99_9CAUD|nr:hypothetical protein PP748_gp034 [Rhizobium phage RHph_Y2_6]QIG68771.1 hypothetical protein EVB68_034 [Rhizobium phage RHph_Y2_6]
MKRRVFKSRIFMNRLDKLEQAAIKLSWIGSRHPDEHADIHKEYRKRRHDLVSYVLNFVLEEPKGE